MLKISESRHSNGEMLLKLEGKIIGPWVIELEKECAKYMNNADSEIFMDFSDVTYICDDGLAFLVKNKKKINIINAQPYIGLCLKRNGLIK